jgi:hypothetical protein
LCEALPLGLQVGQVKWVPAQLASTSRLGWLEIRVAQQWR